MTEDLMAKHGEKGFSIAEWGVIESDNRLRIPSEVLASMEWYRTSKACPVLIELREPGCIRIHDPSRAAELSEQRQLFLEEFSDQAEAQRRIAISQAIFIPAAIGKTNRRITLQSAILDHLRLTKSDRVLCLGYANMVEILGEERFQTLSTTIRVDISLD